MKKEKFYTKDFPRFKSHEWKMISTKPESFEALKDGVIVKYFDYDEAKNYSSKDFSQLVFDKGDRIQVSDNGKRFCLTCDYRLSKIGDSFYSEVEFK